MMERLLYFAAVASIRCVQALPLVWAARLGRTIGGLVYYLDARHRRVALRNLSDCFRSEQSAHEIRRVAREHFRRLGENYTSAIKTAAMSWDQLRAHVEFAGLDAILAATREAHEPSCVVAIGHFGNFELYARWGQAFPDYHCATTYRALKQPSLNRLLQSLREQSGCLFFERRTEADQLKTALARGSLMLGLLSDQHAGERGVSALFFGRPCSTTPAPAILAQRYGYRLFTGICYRVALARWRIEAGREIATRSGEAARSVADIMQDVNTAFEAAVRRDPANWFWVHNRWKPFRSRSGRAPAPARTNAQDSACPPIHP